MKFAVLATARAIDVALAKHADAERIAVLAGGYAPSGLRYIEGRKAR